jgi:hypothetical protein
MSSAPSFNAAERLSIKEQYGKQNEADQLLNWIKMQLDKIKRNPTTEDNVLSKAFPTRLHLVMFETRSFYCGRKP